MPPTARLPCRKLEAAEQLVGALLGSGTPDAVAEAAALPPLVAAHYLRSLVEWSSSALIKGGSADAGGKKGKKAQQQQPGKQAAAGEQQAARLEPRCWAVLVSVLGSPGIPASQPLPAALLPAATAALQQAGQGQGPAGAQQAELLCQLASLLHLLAGKFGGSFRPGIEHAAALAEAGLAGRAAACQAAADSAAAWEETARAAVRLLAAVASGHPNQRKVWDAAVPRLLPLLAGAAFPADSAAAGSQLASSCRQVLEALLFSQQHVVPLATAAAAEFDAVLAEAQAGGSGSGDAPATHAAAAEGQQEESEEEMEVDGDGTADASIAKQAQHGAAGGYAAQLFAVLRRLVAARDLPLQLLPWMAGCFCVALKQHRRVAETGAQWWEGEAATVRSVKSCVSSAHCRCKVSRKLTTSHWTSHLHSLAEAELTSQADRRSKAQQQQQQDDAAADGLPIDLPYKMVFAVSGALCRLPWLTGGI